MNVYIETSPVKTNKFWRPIYEVTENSYFEEKRLFPTKVLEQCKNNPNEPQNIPNEIKLDLKNGYGTGVVCTSGYDPPKGVKRQKGKKDQEI